jgi:hypothetical protein
MATAKCVTVYDQVVNHAESSNECNTGEEMWGKRKAYRGEDASEDEAAISRRLVLTNNRV